MYFLYPANVLINILKFIQLLWTELSVFHNGTNLPHDPTNRHFNQTADANSIGIKTNNEFNAKEFTSEMV